MYADETHNTYVSDNEHDKDRQTKRGITECSQLVKSKQTSLNVTKTELVLIASGQRLSTMTVSPMLAINDFPFNQVSSAKSLGVTIDDNLDWGRQIEDIIKKSLLASGP